jgi:hypothetical protein
MEPYKTPGPRGIFTPVVFLTLGAILTIAIILGIKYMVGTDSENSAVQAPAGNVVFKSGNDLPPGYNPLPSVAASTATSLDMFEKANANAAAEEENSTCAIAAAAAPPRTTVKPARPAPKTEKTAKPRTVIPRMGAFKNFGAGSQPSGQAAPGNATPDITSLLKQAQQRERDGN